MSEDWAETGIYIRAKIGESWESIDLGDPRLPDDQLVAWLRSGEPERELPLRVCLLLLGRGQEAADVPSEGGNP